jgi:uncharacterized membrane protein
MVVLNVVVFPIASFFFARGLVKRENKARFVKQFVTMVLISIIIQVAFSMLIELPVLDEPTS